MVTEYKVQKKSFDKNYLSLFYTVATCLIIFFLLTVTREFSYKIFDTNTFLTLHFFTELLSILIAFSIFTVLYYTFDGFKRLRFGIFSYTFLIIGFIDIFHVLSYEGMPILIKATTPQMATTFWITARIVMAVGFLLSAMVGSDRKIHLNKGLLLIFSILIIMVVFYIVIFQTQMVPPLFIQGKGLTKLKVSLEYFVIILQIVASILYLREYRQTKNKLLIGFIVALIISIFSEVTFTFYQSVYDTINLMGHIFKIISYFVMFKVLFIANVEKPYKQVDNLRYKLKEHADNLESIVTEKTRELVSINERLVFMNNKLMEDLDSARQIQQSLLPVEHQRFEALDFYSEFIPCQRLSGDFYNYFKIDDDHIGMYIVDVSGHGTSAAMVTVFADRVLNLENKNKRYMNYSLLSPKDVLENFYDIFNYSDFPDETHLVLIFGIYDIKQKKLTFATAGHNCEPILISKGKGVSTLNYDSGFPICKLKDIYQPSYQNYEIKLSSGDKILFYTDGVTELSNEKGEIYSQERLVALLEEKINLKSSDLLFSIIDDLSAYKGLREIDDDITLFVMEAME